MQASMVPPSPLLREPTRVVASPTPHPILVEITATSRVSPSVPPFDGDDRGRGPHTPPTVCGLSSVGTPRDPGAPRATHCIRQVAWHRSRWAGGICPRRVTLVSDGTALRDQTEEPGSRKPSLGRVDQLSERLLHRAREVWTPWRTVVAFGVVSLAGDMVYEGMRSVAGPFLGSLGASALVVGSSPAPAKPSRWSCDSSPGRSPTAPADTGR